MSRLYPVRFMWTSEHAMRPIDRFAKLAQRQYQVGEVYTLEVRESRSSASHAQYFAALDEAFENLSAEQTAELKTSKHLRGWALIETGFYDELIGECETHDEAVRLAMFARRQHDRDKPEYYAEIRVKGNIMVYRTPKSQALDSMDREEFERSKNAVLSLLADRLGVTKKQLERQGKEHAE